MDNKASIKVADEVWVATALLHRENPEKSSFRVKDIVDRAGEECRKMNSGLRPGVQVHAYLHCVADKRPNPGTYRMLSSTDDGGRRLYRPGDKVHEWRNGKQKPKREDLPVQYRPLLDWYENDYCKAPPNELQKGE